MNRRSRLLGAALLGAAWLLGAMSMVTMAALPGSPVEDVVGLHITGVAIQAEATGLLVWLEVPGPSWPDLDHVARRLSEWAGGVPVDVVVEPRPASWPLNAILSGRASAPCPT
jgi:hypothetical protein